jgi:hypothetical protein
VMVTIFLDVSPCSVVIFIDVSERSTVFNLRVQECGEKKQQENR